MLLKYILRNVGCSVFAYFRSACQVVAAAHIYAISSDSSVDVYTYTAVQLYILYYMVVWYNKLRFISQFSRLPTYRRDSPWRVEFNLISRDLWANRRWPSPGRGVGVYYIYYTRVDVHGIDIWLITVCPAGGWRLKEKSDAIRRLPLTWMDRPWQSKDGRARSCRRLPHRVVVGRNRLLGASERVVTMCVRVIVQRLIGPYHSIRTNYRRHASACAGCADFGGSPGENDVRGENRRQ